MSCYKHFTTKERESLLVLLKKVAYSQKSGQEIRKKLQSKLTAKVRLDLIRGQPAKRRMRSV